MAENGVSGDWLLKEAMAYLASGAIRQLQSSPKQGRKKFTGKEFDEEGGMDHNYLGARYYDADVGLWTAMDPAREFFTPYAYTSGNTVIMIDPNGLWFKVFTQNQTGVTEGSTYYKDETTLSFKNNISKHGIGISVDAVLTKHTEFGGEAFEGSNTNVSIGKVSVAIAFKWLEKFKDIVAVGGKSEVTALSIGKYLEGYSENIDLNLNLGSYGAGAYAFVDKGGHASKMGKKGKMGGVASQVLSFSGDVEKK